MVAVASRGRTALLFFAAAAVAWIVTVERMRGMDEGPGTDLGTLGWYLGVWVTMSAAMMLPSAVPTAAVVARISRGLPTVLFGVGYLVVWTVYGLAAYGVFRLVTSLDPDWLAWDRGGPYATGTVLVVAGLYELTPLKAACLSRCRIVEHGPSDRLSGLRAGVRHGLYCVGASWALMAVLFALGVMSVLWMVVVAGVIFAEKVLPHDVQIRRVVGAALVALGVWAAISPGSVPGLTEPVQSPGMQMEMEMER
jgi:predicted metal-binding membrane protein